MIRRILWLALAHMLVITPVFAAGFTVTPDSDGDCTDFDCTLQKALDAAAANGQDDAINLAAGEYVFDAPLVYNPENENHALSILGQPDGATLLKGVDNGPLLGLYVTQPADTSAGHITLKHVWMEEAPAGGMSKGAPPPGATFADLDIITGGDVTLEDVRLDIENASVWVLCEGDIEVLDSGLQAYASGGCVIDLTAKNMVLWTLIPYSESGDSSVSIIASGNVFFNEPVNPGSNGNGNGGSGSSAGATICAFGDCDFFSDIVEVGYIEVNPDIPPVDWSIHITEGSPHNLPWFYNSAIEMAGCAWTQTCGMEVALSDPHSYSPVFMPPPAGQESVKLCFSRVITYTDGTTKTSAFEYTVEDNGIDGFPENAYTFNGLNDQEMGAELPAGGRMARIAAMNPGDLADASGKPDNLIYGVLDMEVRVDNPGDTATVVIYLPEPAPPGYRWYKYSPARGWYDYSAHAAFNGDRTQVALTLQDGGFGDDDGLQNGVIVDPSGLGAPLPTNASGSASGSDGGGGGGNCFISALE